MASHNVGHSRGAPGVAFVTLGGGEYIDLKIVDAVVPPDPVLRFGCLEPRSRYGLGDDSELALFLFG